MTEKVNQSTKVEKVDQDKQSLDSLIAQASKIGHDSVPAGTSELESKIQGIFDNSGKIMSAKEVFSIIKERDAKYY